ncbi:MAG: ATP-binding protein [Hyphomicrobiales bacterium]
MFNPMLPPDSAQARPDNLTDAWPPHPLADEAADAVVGAALAKGAPAAIWALIDGRVLWWNEAGAALFELPRADGATDDVGAALARAAGSDRPWLERRRLSQGRRLAVATLRFSRTRLRDGTHGLIAVATAVVPPIVANGRAVAPPTVILGSQAPDGISATGELPPGRADTQAWAEAPPAGRSSPAAGKDEGEAPVGAIRRLTWQTDTTGRLLAGPGASLSQVLGRGAPMQPAPLSELFAENGAAVAEAIASGRPFVGVPVATLAAPDGTSFTGHLFGAPVLDHGRQVAGYRGFFVVSRARLADRLTSDNGLLGAETAPSSHSAEMGGSQPLAGEHHAGSEMPQPEIELAAADTVGAGFPTDEDALPMVAASVAGDVSHAALSAALGQSQAPRGPVAHAPPQLVASASSPAEQTIPPPRPVEISARASNVIALRPPGADPSRLKEQEASMLSPAERDAFADIAKALGASWTTAVARPDPASPMNGLEQEAASRQDIRSSAEASAIAPRDDAGKTAPGTGRAAEWDGLIDAPGIDLATIINRLPVGILVHRAGAAVAANRTLLNLIGYASLHEFEAHGGFERLFVDHRDGRAQERAVAINTRGGEVVEVDARCQAIKWRGAAATLLSLRRSLAGETKSLEAAHRSRLAAKEAELDDLRAILDGAIDGVVTVDDLGRILAMNHAAQRLFGYGAGEIAGEALAVLVAPECHHSLGAALDNARAPIQRAAVPLAQEITGRERQGRRIPLSMKLFAGSASHASRRLHAVFRDLTAAKNSEAGLVEARVTAERTTAQKSEFLAKISHEIRTPLNSIVGFADIIAEERFGPLENERYKEYVKDIRASGTHIISLVNDLLDLSKIEAGRMELSFTNVNLNTEVSAGVALVQMEAARSRVLMRQSLAQGLPAIVADARSIKQIVLNLLSNAVKFTEPGGQVIVSTALSDKGEVIFRVRDTGIGMSERELAEAMEPFKQFATTQRPGGTGLGLSLTKALVKANHASLSITSGANEGTLVEVVFPQARVMAT